jgi:hypothetical protein
MKMWETSLVCLINVYKVLLFIKTEHTYLRQPFGNYYLVVESRFACPSDPERYAGGSVSYW